MGLSTKLHHPLLRRRSTFRFERIAVTPRGSTVLFHLQRCRSGSCPVGRATGGGSHLSKVESKGEERYTPVHPHERCQPQGQTELEMTTLAWVGN